MQGKQGFTMFELLICMYIVSSLTVLMIPWIHRPDFSDQYFVLEALSLQSKAMSTKEEQSLWIDGFELNYNASGNISQAHTFIFDKNEITAQLGWGRLVEK